MENQFIAWSDWEYNEQFPYNEIKRSQAMLSEAMLFEKQERLKIEANERRAESEEMIERKKREFELDENERRTRMFTTLHQCWFQSIDETRRRFVPAYTFTRFLELPLEIQLKIWSMAVRTRDPRTFSIVKRNDDAEYIRTSRFDRTSPAGSSRIYFNIGRDDNEPVPPVLQVCRTSRIVALEVYSMLPCKDIYLGRTNTLRYSATPIDKFYMSGQWYEYKLLVDMMIKRNTTRPLLHHVQADLNRLLCIKHFIVDFNIFAAVPVDLWADFYNLESLTISIFPPYQTVDTFEQTLHFVKPDKKTTLGKRAKWVHERALLSFESAKATKCSEWLVPTIKVVAQLTETGLDLAIGEDCSDDDTSQVLDAAAEAEHIGEDETGGGNQEDRDQAAFQKFCESDWVWHNEAEATMTHTIPMAHIRGYKHKYQPSHKLSIIDLAMQPDGPRKKLVGDFLTDSESEFIDKDADPFEDDWL